MPLTPAKMSEEARRARIRRIKDGMPPLVPPGQRSTITVPLLEALTAYQQKGVGIDMVLKSVMGIVRLCMLYSTNPSSKRRFAKVADTIVECRMLCNFGRPAITLHQGLKTVAERNRLGLWCWLFLTLSYFLRVPEQISGDLGYMQKVVFHRWSRQRLSFFYRFFKSLSLTCCVLSELCRRPALKLNIAMADTPALKEKTELDLTVSNVLIVRTLCDMYVYYKWIPSYTPNKTLEYLFGSVSGVMGVWLVWKDTRYIRQCLEHPREDKEPCAERGKVTHIVTGFIQSCDDGDVSGASGGE